MRNQEKNKNNKLNNDFVSKNKKMNEKIANEFKMYIETKIDVKETYWKDSRNQIGK